MNNKFLCLAVIFAVSVISVIVFAVYSWHFLDDSCLLEILLMLVGGVVIAYIGHFKCPPKSKNQSILFFGLILLNLTIVIPPFITGGNLTSTFAFVMYHALFLLLMLFLEKRKHFLLSACYMIYGSAIAYRIETLCSPDYCAVNLPFFNLAMIISVFVLFSISSALILFKRFPEE